MRTSSTLFGGRVIPYDGGRSEDKSEYTDGTRDHLNGHGTHVVGTICAQKYGVVPLVHLINFKVIVKGDSVLTIAKVCFHSYSLPVRLTSFSF